MKLDGAIRIRFPSLTVSWMTVHLAVLSGMLSLIDVEGKDYCSTESFHGHCPTGSVILVSYARYGRMRLGRCVRVDFGFIGCSSDVTHVLDKYCSGRPECKIRIPDSQLDETKPCIGDLTRYLEAAYECIPVQLSESHGCHGSVRLALPLPTGYLLGPSGSVTAGLIGCSRVVTGAIGQRINLTLYDFGFSARPSLPPLWLPSSSPPVMSSPTGAAATRLDQPLQQAMMHPGSGGNFCRRLALVTDVAARTVVDVCSHHAARISHAYLSVGNSVEIRILREPGNNVGKDSMQTQGSGGGHFLLRYDVVGCPELRLASSYWVRKSETEATIGCFSSGRSWRLSCRGRAWSGEIGNCTEENREFLTSANYPTKEDAVLDVPPSLSTGLAAIIVVVIAVTVGVCVSLAGILIIRRKGKFVNHCNGCLNSCVGGSSKCDVGNAQVILKSVRSGGGGGDYYHQSGSGKRDHQHAARCRVWSHHPIPEYSVCDCNATDNRICSPSQAAAADIVGVLCSAQADNFGSPYKTGVKTTPIRSYVSPGHVHTEFISHGNDIGFLTVDESSGTYSKSSTLSRPKFVNRDSLTYDSSPVLLQSTQFARVRHSTVVQDTSYESNEHSEDGSTLLELQPDVYRDVTNDKMPPSGPCENIL